MGRVPQRPGPPAGGTGLRGVPSARPSLSESLWGGGSISRGHPPGLPYISLLPVVVADGCPPFRGRGNASPLRRESNPARRPGAPGGVRRWGGGGRSAKAEGGDRHPRGAGRGAPGADRPVEGLSGEDHEGDGASFGVGRRCGSARAGLAPGEEKTGTFCRSGLEGASHKMYLSPFLPCRSQGGAWEQRNVSRRK